MLRSGCGTEDAVTPEEILSESRLTEDEKADLLCRMAYDAAEQAVALEEGMPGADEDAQRRVLVALSQMHREMDIEHTSPTKQRGMCLLQREQAGGPHLSRCP
jgi:hypothetical protein